MNLMCFGFRTAKSLGTCLQVTSLLVAMEAIREFEPITCSVRRFPRSARGHPCRSVAVAEAVRKVALHAMSSRVHP